MTTAAEPDFDLPDFLAEVHYAVESKHQTHGVQCTWGFTSFVKRDHTKHIVTETLREAGLTEGGEDQ